MSVLESAARNRSLSHSLTPSLPPSLSPQNLPPPLMWAQHQALQQLVWAPRLHRQRRLDRSSWQRRPCTRHWSSVQAPVQASPPAAQAVQAPRLHLSTGKYTTHKCWSANLQSEVQNWQLGAHRDSLENHSYSEKAVQCTTSVNVVCNVIIR